MDIDLCLAKLSGSEALSRKELYLTSSILQPWEGGEGVRLIRGVLSIVRVKSTSGGIRVALFSEWYTRFSMDRLTNWNKRVSHSEIVIVVGSCYREG